MRRRLLLQLFQAGLARVEGRRCTRDALADISSKSGHGRVWAAAIGKAASSMLLGAQDALGERLERALLITKEGHVTPEVRSVASAEIYESSHPVPDERSLAAGRRLLQWVEELPPDVEPLFLVSGGASSLVEVLEEGVTLQDLERLTAEGLASGVPIDELNARRVRLSRIKGGKLTARLGGRAAHALFISDVPSDDPAVIGSGVLGPASHGKDDVRRSVIASVDDAMDAVCAAARTMGLEALRDSHRFSGDAVRLAVRFSHELRMSTVPVRVWGGESVVHLPQDPGRGGRNQHLALAAARLIAGHDDLLLLAAGTDGTDGPTDDAGALVDGETCARIALASLDVDECLRRADSGAALAAAGDLVHTGPTGTNVGDLVIGLKLSEAAVSALPAGLGNEGAP